MGFTTKMMCAAIDDATMINLVVIRFSSENIHPLSAEEHIIY